MNTPTPTRADRFRLPESVRRHYPDVAEDIWDNLAMAGDHGSTRVYDSRNGKTYCVIMDAECRNGHVNLMDKVADALKAHSPVHKRMYPRIAK